MRLKSRVEITGSGLMDSLRPVVAIFVEVVFVTSKESKNEETSLRFMSGHFGRIERQLHTCQPLRRDCYLGTSKNLYRTN